MDIYSIVNIKEFFAEYGIEVSETTIKIDNSFCIESKSLADHLRGSVKCVVFTITLGSEVDFEIRKKQVESMAAAYELDKQANIYIEKLATKMQEAISIEARKNGFTETHRFSPGFGDLKLDYQKLFLKLSKAKHITVTDSNLLIPQKTITAVIGLKKV